MCVGVWVCGCVFEGTLAGLIFFYVGSKSAQNARTSYPERAAGMFSDPDGDSRVALLHPPPSLQNYFA